MHEEVLSDELTFRFVPPGGDYNIPIETQQTGVVWPQTAPQWPQFVGQNKKKAKRVRRSMKQ